MSKKRELSPASRERNQRPLQQQKSISDIIGPMVDRCQLDLANNQSLASLATVTYRQQSEEGNPNVEEETYYETQAGELEAGFTDADGRVSDAAKAAAKAVKKAGKKGARALAEDIESAVHATKDIIEGTARSYAEGVEDTVDAIGSLVNKSVGHAGRAFNQQSSIEDKPSNNVHISHPTDGAGQMVPMGMHIQPEIFKAGSGQKVLMVEPGKLADQASLKENDVIIAIGDTEVTEKSLDEVLHIFGTISSTFSMTVVRRRLHLVLVRHIITIEVLVNDDDAVAIKVLDVKCSRLYINRTVQIPNFHISHGMGTSSLKYMKVTSNGTLTMDSQVHGSESEFKMNVYDTRDCEVPEESHRPITLQNVSCNKAVAIGQENNEYQVCLNEAHDLMGDDIGVDFRFFYNHYPDTTDSYLRCFESSENSTQGMFLAVVDGCLRLDSYTGAIGDIPSKFKFKIVYSHQE